MGWPWKQVLCFVITTTLCFKTISSIPISTTTQRYSRSIDQKSTPRSQHLLEKIIVYSSNNATSNTNDTVAKKTLVEHKEHDQKIQGKELPLLNHEQQYAEEAKKIIDRMTNEELKIRCQHLSRILSVSNTNVTPTTYHRLITRKPQQDTIRRPVYIHNKPTYVQNARNTSKKPGGFYITTQASSTTYKPIHTVTTPRTTQATVKRFQTTTQSTLTTNNVKYIRLEPVILQKTILSDGRVLYYWHRSLPTAVEYPTSQKSTEEPISTTTEYTSYLSFRNLLPFYGTSSKEITSTTVPSTTMSETQNLGNYLYNQQLKFVVPIPYGNSNVPTIRKPWDFDHFAYYPKELQPNDLRLQVPYTPTFHVIKSITIPNAQYESIEKT